MQVLKKILQEIEVDYDVPFFATEAEGRAFMQGKAAQAREDRRIIRSHMEDVADTNGGKNEPVSNPAKLDDGWIPVEEHLPEDDNYILLSFANFSLPMVGRYEKDEEGSGAFYLGDCDEEDTCVANDLFVNAWQPLPEPYQPEKKGE